MFCVLVGDSGIARKTTSVANASRIVRHAIARYADVGMLDAKVTPEALDKLLHDKTATHGNAQLCIAVAELAVFMGTERYIAHMPTLLTELYDCPAARDGGGTITRGDVVQRDVWVHFLAASTPIWLLKTVNPNVIEGGFTSRCYFIIANAPKQRIAWPQEMDEHLYQDMREDLEIIAAEARTRPPIGLHEDALALFTKWYAERPHSLDPYKQTFEAREDAHVLRIAALLCINDGSWLIHDCHIQLAITAIDGIKENSANIFENSEVRNKYAGALDAIRMQLLSTGMDPIPRGRLYLKLRHKLDNQEFHALLDVLHDLGAIQRFDLHNKRGRPVDLIRGTQKLMAPNLGDKVIERFS
jgi:hypothetical protein